MEKEFPQIVAGRAPVKTLWLDNLPPDVLHLAKKEARIPDDIKGMKLGATAPLHELIQGCGASPVDIQPPDWYTSLERGVVEGIFLSYEVLDSHKLQEVAKVHLDVPISTTVGVNIMNMDTWNSLPSDIQQIIEGTVAEIEQEQFNDGLAGNKEVRDRLAASPDHTIIEPTEDELALWRTKAMPYHQAWIDKMEAEGLPGQAAYDKLIEIINRYK